MVYHISVDPADAARIKIAADKIVDGQPDFMGDMLLKYDAAKNTLVGNLETPRVHGIWEFTIKGNMMWGTLTVLPDKTIARQIRVTKNSNQGGAAMTQHVSGTFEVKITPVEDKSSDSSLGRMTFEKQWQGELSGTSRGQMLTGGDVKAGSAGYVAIEKFTGTLKNKKGSFILQHSATMTKGKGDLTITVVPDSGTDELQGISGKITIRIENGKHFYDFEYSISKSQ